VRPWLEVARRSRGAVESFRPRLTRHAPNGERGGGDAATGRNLVNGEEVPAKETRDLEAGDVVTIETPGGGGWGQ